MTIRPDGRNLLDAGMLPWTAHVAPELSPRRDP